MVTRSAPGTPSAPEAVIEKPVMSRAPYDPGRVNTKALQGRAVVVTRDTLWYIRHNPLILVAVIGVIVALIGLFLGTHVFGGRLFPNVWALNVNLGDMTLDEAAQTLQNKWMTGTQIQLRDGDRIWSVTPAQLGLTLDAAATVESARNVGLAGFRSATASCRSSAWIR
ncbi:MAG: hypothetical protein LC121_15025 [Anaerolineae bacterium]|nr:hypothetical protein [Anaerolineae bacterium]